MTIVRQIPPAQIPNKGKVVYPKLKIIPLVPEEILFVIIDLFCGFGGMTEGFEAAVNARGNRIAVVLAAVNHDPEAIQSHSLNHAHTHHFTEDIRDTTLPMRIVALIKEAKALYPNAKILLHASLECTNFSLAKGGLSRDPDSRSLPEHMPMYLHWLTPSYFTIENVKEFQDWGPMEAKRGKTKEGYAFCKLDKKYEGKGKKKKFLGFGPCLVPMKEYKGLYFEQWKEQIKALGYEYDSRIENVADFGANTSRTRYFAVFYRPGMVTAWPEKTHAKDPSKVKGKTLLKWNAVRPCLQLEEKGKSIFGRKIPLVENTLKRLYAGLVKHVAGGSEEFLSKYFTGDGMNLSIEGPAHTITAIDHHALVQTEKFLMNYQSGSDKHRCKSLSDPAQTLTTENRLALVTSEQFCASYYGKGDNTSSIESPCPTIPTKDRVALISSEFIDQQFGKSKPSSVNEPCGCLTANQHYALVQAVKEDQFMSLYYSQGQQDHGLQSPSAAITTNPKQRLVSTEWIMTNMHQNKGVVLDQPSPTLCTGNHQYLMSTQYDNVGRELERPAGTITADRHWDYLVTAEGGYQVAIIIHPNDSPTMRKIKAFMAYHGIIDIKMRMLFLKELLRIQGFPESYQMVGSQTACKKFIGNSVPPKYPKVWLEAKARKIYAGISA